MPPPSGREVFPVLKDGFFTSFGITVNTIDPVRNRPHKILQGLEAVRVGARVVLCVSVLTWDKELGQCASLKMRIGPGR